MKMGGTVNKYRLESESKQRSQDVLDPVTSVMHVI